MKRRILCISGIVAIGPTSALCATTEFVNFDNQISTLTKTDPSGDPEQTVVIPGVATFSGGLVGNATSGLNGTYVTLPNAYATAYTGGSANATNPMSSTITIGISPSYSVDQVSLPVFNGAPMVLSYQVDAFSGSTLVASQTLSNIPAYAPKDGAADPDVEFADLTASSITSVTITPTTLPNGDWDFIIDSVGFNQGAVPSLIWDNAGGASPSDGATWDVSHNNNWNNATATTAYTDGSAVTFDDSNNDHYAVTLNTTVSPAAVTFVNDSGNYTISGSGTIAGNGVLTMAGTSTVTLATANAYTGGTTISTGTLVASTPGSLPATGTISNGGALDVNANNSSGAINGPGTISIAPGITLTLATRSGQSSTSQLNIGMLSTLNVTNNHIFINYGSGTDPISSIASWIASGFNNGKWTGTGIDSSTAAANAGSYGIGYADYADPGNPAGLSSGQIEIAYTLLGDANLDGKVNGADFTLMAAHFNDSVTNGWDEGDFNYDGKVNGSDFVLLADNFNDYASQSAVAAGDLMALDDFAAANGISLSTVPEPGIGGLLIASSLGILIRRRRGHFHTMV